MASQNLLQLLFNPRRDELRWVLTIDAGLTLFFVSSLNLHAGTCYLATVCLCRGVNGLVEKHFPR